MSVQKFYQKHLCTKNRRCTGAVPVRLLNLRTAPHRTVASPTNNQALLSMPLSLNPRARDLFF